MSEPNDRSDAGMTPLKRAFIALENMRARLAAAEGALREPVAVIGLGCRVPGGGDDAQSFWSLLHDGVDEELGIVHGLLGGRGTSTCPFFEPFPPAASDKPGSAGKKAPKCSP